jgi:hypothetical protein
MSGHDARGALRRPPLVLGVALLLAAFGAWRLLQLLPLVALGTLDAVLLLGRAAECAFALLAAVGLWLRRPWAIACVWATAIAIALVALYEAFVPGILAPLAAIAIALAALVVAAILAQLLRRA